MLSNTDIKKYLSEKKIEISDMQDDQVSFCSIDLRLGETFKVFKHAEVTHIDPRVGVPENLMETVIASEEKPFIIHPREFVLGTTHEYIKIPLDLMGRLDGRSSWGRLGIIIHSTAGLINPGFEGKITLEITNLNKVPIKLWPGLRICQITFEKLTTSVDQTNLTQKYKGQTTVGTTLIHKDKEIQH